ncbi:MFS transporter [Dactylosporangium sp. NPDC051484]|uniref:MFS transporter n=1 Tax=Dactylosporangium sp. NPDC051484 TaxID=3154942 RepID=UPI00344CFDEF
MRRDLAILGAGLAVSTAGDAAALVALLLRLEPHGSGWVAGLLAAELVPYVVLAPITGRIVDRFETRAVLLAALAGQALLCVPLAFATPLWAILALFAGVTALSAFVRPATAALVPAITGEEGAARGYSVLATGTGLGWIAGPATGGLLTGVFGSTTAVLVDAATFAVLTLACSALAARRRPAGATAASASPPTVGSRTPTDADAADARGDADATDAPGDSDAVSAPRAKPVAEGGLRLIFADRLLRTALVGSAIAISSGVIDNVAAPFRFVGQLGASQSGYGLYLTLWGVGALLGAQILPRIRMSDHAGLALGNLLTGAGIAGIGLAPNLTLAFVASTLGGLGNGLANVAQSALISGRTPAAQHGRAFAATGAVIQTAIGVGTAAASPLVALLHADGAMIVAGALTCATSGIALAISGNIAKHATVRNVSRKGSQRGGEAGGHPGATGNALAD